MEAKDVETKVVSDTKENHSEEKDVHAEINEIKNEEENWVGFFDGWYED